MIKAYYAILLFICLGVKPFYTIGYVAYYELNIDYIVEKYCVNKAKPVKFKCNGKCHLAKKLSFTTNVEEKTDKQAISSSLREAFFPVYYQVSNSNFKTIDLLDLKKLNWFFYEVDYNVFLSITSPPPQC